MQIHLTQLDIVCVGTVSADVRPLVADYERRVSRYVRMHVHEVKAEPTKRGESLVLRAEAERLQVVLNRVRRPGSTRVVRLDSRGRTPTSEQLAAQWLAAEHLVLIIGGTMGLDRSIIDCCDDAVSFGRITIPHQLARLLVTEQVYRAFRIARGEPYHF